MSIAKMIAAHPHVAGNINEPLALAVRHLMFCAIICTSCADACAAETVDDMRRQCIRVCADCADVCAAAAKIATRRTGSNEALIQAMLRTCIQACTTCAQHCEMHDDEHCRLCAAMCRECAEDCAKALSTFG